jgi:hypothetical protein
MVLVLVVLVIFNSAGKTAPPPIPLSLSHPFLKVIVAVLFGHFQIFCVYRKISFSYVLEVVVCFLLGNSPAPEFFYADISEHSAPSS